MVTIVQIRTRALRSLIPPPRLRLSDWIERKHRPARRRVGAAGPRPALAVSKRNCRRDLRPDDRTSDAVQRRAARLHNACSPARSAPTSPTSRPPSWSCCRPTATAATMWCPNWSRSSRPRRRCAARWRAIPTRAAANPHIETLCWRLAARHCGPCAAQLAAHHGAHPADRRGGRDGSRRPKATRCAWPSGGRCPTRTARSSSARRRSPRTPATSCAPTARATAASTRCHAPSAAASPRSHGGTSSGKPIIPRRPRSDARIARRSSHERHKAAWSPPGQWRATRPECRAMPAFGSTPGVAAANASWAKLAAEFIACKEDASRTSGFHATPSWRKVGTRPAPSWTRPRCKREPRTSASTTSRRGSGHHDRLRSRRGQHRDNASSAGRATGEALILGHHIIWGSPASDDTVWLELDELLRTKWRHPHGGTLRVDAAIIDSRRLH